MNVNFFSNNNFNFPNDNRGVFFAIVMGIGILIIVLIVTK
jgi:hypothetical protein